MAVNQEALTTQMEDLKAGAVALPGGRPQFTQKIVQTDIDIPGGPGVLSTGEIPTLGKKKQDQPVTQTASADLLAEMLSGLDIDPVNVDPVGVAEVVAEQATNPSVTSDNEILFKAKDLGTLDGDPELGGFIRTEVDSSLQGLTDLDFTDPTRAVEVDDFTVAGSEPFQISDEFSTQSERAAQQLQKVAFQTAFQGADLLPTIKETTQNFVLQNSGLVGEGIRFKNSVERISNSSLDNPFSAVGAGSAALNAAQILGNTVRNIEKNGIEAVIEDTFDRIKSSIVGIADMVTNPGDTFKMLHNNMWWGASRPTVTAVDLSHGRHSFVMDDKGNLATPAWVGLLAQGPVGAAFQFAQHYLSRPGSGPGGSPLQVARGSFGSTKTFGDIGEGVAPSYRDAVIQNYHNMTDAILPGGLKWTENSTTYSSESNTYVNMGAQVLGGERLVNTFNLDLLAKFDAPFGQYTHEQIEAASPEFNTFKYNDEERIPYVQAANRSLLELRDVVSEATGREITTGAELSEVLKGKDFHGQMNTAFSDILYGPEGYDPATDNLTDLDIQKHKADLLRKQGGMTKLLFGATKKTVPPAIKPTDVRDNFADSVANDHNFTYGMNRSLFSVGNIIARAGKDTTGNWTYGFNEADKETGYIGDTALSTAIHDFMQINHGGDMSKLTEGLAKDIAKQYAFDKEGADSIGKQAVEKLTGGTVEQPVTKEVVTPAATDDRIEKETIKLLERKKKEIEAGLKEQARVAEAGEPAEGPSSELVVPANLSEELTKIEKALNLAKQGIMPKEEVTPAPPPVELLPQEIPSGTAVPPIAEVTQKDLLAPTEAAPTVERPVERFEDLGPGKRDVEEQWGEPAGPVIERGLKLVSEVTQKDLLAPTVPPDPGRTPSLSAPSFEMGKIINASDLSRVTPKMAEILQEGRGSYRQDLYESEEGYDFAAEARAREAASPEVQTILADLAPKSLTSTVAGSGIVPGTAFPKAEVTEAKLQPPSKTSKFESVIPGRKPVGVGVTIAGNVEEVLNENTKKPSGSMNINAPPLGVVRGQKDGIVVHAGPFRGFENLVIIGHLDPGKEDVFLGEEFTSYTLIGGMQDLNVEVDSIVKQGTELGNASSRIMGKNAEDHDITTPIYVETRSKKPEGLTKDKVQPGLVEGIFNTLWGKAKETVGEIIPHSKQLVIQPEVSEPAPAPAPAIPGMTGPPGRDYSTAKYSDDPVDYPSDYDYGGWY